MHFDNFNSENLSLRAKYLLIISEFKKIKKL